MSRLTKTQIKHDNQLSEMLTKFLLKQRKHPDYLPDNRTYEDNEVWTQGLSKQREYLDVNDLYSYLTRAVRELEQLKTTNNNSRYQQRLINKLTSRRNYRKLHKLQQQAFELLDDLGNEIDK